VTDALFGRRQAVRLGADLHTAAGVASRRRSRGLRVVLVPVRGRQGGVLWRGRAPAVAAGVVGQRQVASRGGVYACLATTHMGNIWMCMEDQDDCDPWRHNGDAAPDELPWLRSRFAGLSVQLGWL
jgi:hypothetical protein